MKSLLPHALIVGLIGGVATWLTVRFQITTWMVFMSFVGYFMFGGRLASGLRMYALFLVGAALGVGAQVFAARAAGPLGQLTFPVIVFVLAGALTFLERVKPLDAIPAYYLGLVTVFASSAPPSLRSFVAMVIPTSFGIFLAWLIVHLRGEYERRLGSRPLSASVARAER